MPGSAPRRVPLPACPAVQIQRPPLRPHYNTPMLPTRPSRRNDSSPLPSQPSPLSRSVAPPRRRWLRYSLRTLLVLITALGIWLGIAFQRAREQAHAVARIRDFGGYVFYDFHGVESPSYNQWQTSKVPHWLLENLGVDFFHDVRLVVFDIVPINDRTLGAIRPLREVRSLQFFSSYITDAGLTHLNAHTKLQRLDILAAENDSGGYDLPSFTDDGLAALAEMHELEELKIDHANIGDPALEHLTGLTQLKWLSLWDTNVTRDGVLRLSKSLPTCNIQIARDNNEDYFGVGPDIPPAP
jgi:hypothetical protein